MPSSKENLPHILIIDNEKLVREELKNFFESKHYKVTEKDNCKDGWELLTSQNPEMVIIEADMPVENGLQFLLRVTQEHSRDTAVIFIASKATIKMTVSALKAGASGFITKPLNLDDIESSVSKSLELHQVRSWNKKVLLYSSFSYEMNFPSDHQYISSTLHYLTENLHERGTYSPIEVSNIGLAIYEALENAIGHGNGSDPVRKVWVKARINHDEAKFTITDEGNGFDVERLPDPTDESNLHNVRGRGVYLMRAFMDEVTFNKRGNEVTMVKRRTQA